MKRVDWLSETGWGRGAGRSVQTPAGKVGGSFSRLRNLRLAVLLSSLTFQPPPWPLFLSGKYANQLL